jgi:hypothetical protein
VYIIKNAASVKCMSEEVSKIHYCVVLGRCHAVRCRTSSSLWLSRTTVNADPHYLTQARYWTGISKCGHMSSEAEQLLHILTL